MRKIKIAFVLQVPPVIATSTPLQPPHRYRPANLAERPRLTTTMHGESHLIICTVKKTCRERVRCSTSWRPLKKQSPDVRLFLARRLNGYTTSLCAIRLHTPPPYVHSVYIINLNVYVLYPTIDDDNDAVATFRSDLSEPTAAMSVRPSVRPSASVNDNNNNNIMLLHNACYRDATGRISKV